MTDPPPEMDPTDADEFRAGLAAFIARARANGVSVTGRSWECRPGPGPNGWDVEIHRLGRHSELPTVRQ